MAGAFKKIFITNHIEQQVQIVYVMMNRCVYFWCYTYIWYVMVFTQFIDKYLIVALPSKTDYSGWSSSATDKVYLSTAHHCKKFARMKTNLIATTSLHQNNMLAPILSSCVLKTLIYQYAEKILEKIAKKKGVMYIRS